MSTTTTHTCGTCGALLNPNRVQRHLDWHENHDKLVARLAKRAARIDPHTEEPAGETGA